MPTTLAPPLATTDRQEKIEISQPTATKTRISTAWVMAVGFVVGLLLLLIFILQNLRSTSIQFFNLHWEIPLGVAMLLAAVAGGFLMALVGTARVVQLSHRLKRKRN